MLYTVGGLILRLKCKTVNRYPDIKLSFYPLMILSISVIILSFLENGFKDFISESSFTLKKELRVYD